MSAGPLIATAWSPTGRRRFRASWFGKVVLQIEEERRIGTASPYREPEGEQARWRDAKISDLLSEVET